MTLRLTRVDNMVVLTNDVPRLTDFYRRVLGLPFFIEYEETPKLEEQWASFDLGSLVLYIFHTTNARPLERRSSINLEDPIGFDSIAFEVEDLDAAVAELEGEVDWAHDGYTPWDHPSGVHYRYRAFFDPDGNMIYLTEPRVRAAGAR
ncbi:VOC family protein [Leucobacter chironomi]|uniref:VOC family protein n=1 Tax=Leucobacter chironomi TaxID=491918 RepID=UPI00041FB97B|nr:VOC family protein [Leucobacter chironomi]